MGGRHVGIPAILEDGGVLNLARSDSWRQLPFHPVIRNIGLHPRESFGCHAGKTGTTRYLVLSVGELRQRFLSRSEIRKGSRVNASSKGRV